MKQEMENKEQSNLDEMLNRYLDEECRYVVLSNPKRAGGIANVKVRPVLVKDRVVFQSTAYVGKQVFHENHSKAEMISQIVLELQNNFKQLQLVHAENIVTVLVSKKGKMTIKQKKIKTSVPKNLNHNRKKQYIIEEGRPVPFLVDLGVMTKEGVVVRKKYDKFRQINRFLEWIQDVEEELPVDRECTIIDFDCGKSYLTFAMYYYLHELKKRRIHMVGLDLKEEVIDHCNALSKSYGYDRLEFLTGDIKDYEGVNHVDMVVTLHACDTATDYALYKALLWDAKVILSVPCCQHELNQKMECEALAPMLEYGIIKERMAALATDAMRAQLLTMKGYDTQILEFIDIENTPKNLLIRAVKNLHMTEEEKKEKKEHFTQFCEFLGGEITLERLIKEDHNA